MERTLAVAEPLWAELTEALSETDESAAVLFAGEVSTEGRRTLLLNSCVWVPEEAYRHRSPVELQIESPGWVPALSRSVAEGWRPIFFHTHPGKAPRPSDLDGRVTEQISPVFESRTDHGYASMILGGTPSEPTFTADFDGGSADILRVVGKRLRLQPAFSDETGDAPDLTIFDRQVRAFGEAGQRILGELRVGIAGSGGTGSAVFEQLVRLGVGRVVLVDDDVVSEKNVTRIHGSTLEDVGRPKVAVLGDHAEAIGLETKVETVEAKVTEEVGFAAIRSCDVVFGCTDDNAGRGVLARLAYYYCLPVIDMGVVISSEQGKVTGLDERLTTVGPGAPCLFCRGRIDARAMAEERLSSTERECLIAEGYARGLDEPDPSVISYTTMIATFAVDEMLERLFGFGLPDPAGEILIRVPERQIRRLAGTQRAECFCSDLRKQSRGDRQPPLDLSWAG